MRTIRQADDASTAKQDRQVLVERMIRKHLRARGIRSASVLRTIESIPREQFTCNGDLSEAYSDRALPIECGQTISQPFIVALMTESLQLTGVEHVLEVGTGSGYQTAILAEQAGSVVSVELHETLSRCARRVIEKLGYKNVSLHVGDGSLGWPEESPFDRVIVTAAAQSIPQTLFDQVAEGGIIVLPLGSGENQNLWSIRKIGGQQKQTHLTGCRFVPLIVGE